MSDQPVAAGKSSYDLIDRDKTFSIIGVEPDSKFLDLACGAGKYSIEIAKQIGAGGMVYAVDLWQQGIDLLNSEIGKTGLKNINTLVADIRKRLPIVEKTIDSCLMATILHDLSGLERDSAVKEAARVLKPGGFLNIIEFKKIDFGPGPPMDKRMDEAEVKELVARHGFVPVAGSDIGEFNYLHRYEKGIS